MPFAGRRAAIFSGPRGVAVQSLCQQVLPGHDKRVFALGRANAGEGQNGVFGVGI